MDNERVRPKDIFRAQYSTTGPMADFFAEFEQLKKDYDGIKIPERLPIAVTKQSDCQELFDISLNAWVENFDRVKISGAIDRLRDPEISEKERRSIMKYFMEVRRIGIIIRNSWADFNTDHGDAPKVHRKFMSAIGRVRDGIRFTQEPAVISAALSELQATLREYPDPRQIFKLKPATPASFSRAFSARVKILENLLSNKTTAKELHQVRIKGMRPIFSLYLLLSLRSRDQAAIDTYLAIRYIDKDLGKKNDRVVKEEINENDQQQASDESKQIARELVAKLY
ncbi:MAG: hypothetical protein Q7K39_04595 [Candidatus Magasanikbacteria bacterium]|nr:hypothetical protein [Candidatus Magasanikbacteria bacterium]